jgi:hypothetical protein
MDGRICLAQKKLFSGEMAEPFSGCLGAMPTIQQIKKIQYVSGIRYGSNGRMVKNPFEKAE